MNLILSSTLFVLICSHENKQLPQREGPVIAIRPHPLHPHLH